MSDIETLQSSDKNVLKGNRLLLPKTTKTMDALPKVPQKSPRFSNDSRYSRWWSLRFIKKTKPGESIAPETQSKNLESLLSAVNSSSQHVRNFYITFLLAGIYIAIIIWSTTDVMLLKKMPVNLPLLNAKLPITGFYTFAPYLYLLIHFNLLLQLCLLSDKLHDFDNAVLKIADTKNRNYYYTRLFPFAFSHALSGRQHSGFLKFLLTSMVWITIIWLPLGLLIGLQVGFLAYHGEQVLALQRWAIVIDLVLLSIFWPIIRAPNGKWMTWILRATGLASLLSWISRRFFATAVVKQHRVLHTLIQRHDARISGQPMVEGTLSFVTLMAVIGFSWGVAVLPDSDNEKQVSEWISDTAGNSWLSVQPLKKDGQHYFRLTEWLFDHTYQQGDSGKNQPRDSIFHRNLRLKEKLLIANEMKPEDEAALKDADEKVREAALKKTVGLILRGRDLRYADFSESLMPKVDFREVNGVPSDLTNTKFESAILTGARMTRTKLQGANFGVAQLQGANLMYAKLQGTDLAYAQLQGVNLSFAQLQGADLGSAQLQGANLVAAQLQGADLGYAQLQGANLESSQLQGAKLWTVQLQGANLGSAKLQGANLRFAQLQGANLRMAKLTLSDIDRAEFGMMTEREIEDMLKELPSHIKNPERLKKIKDRLIKESNNRVSLAKAHGNNIWIEVPDEIVQKALKESDGNLEVAKTELDYQNGLADFLIELSCQDKWTASGFIGNRPNHMLLKTSFAQCLLTLKDKKTKSGQPVCPGVSEISKKDIDNLKQRASKAEPENNIQPTFKCAIGVSD